MMILSPHMVAETILRTRRDPIWRKAETCSPLALLCAQAVPFEFGDLECDKEHKAFAIDLYERGLFTLPFPVTGICFEAKPQPNLVLGTMGARASGLVVLSQGDEGALHAIVCGELRDEHGVSHGGVPQTYIRNAVVKANSGDRYACDITGEVMPLLSDPILRMMHGPDLKAALLEREMRAYQAMMGAMGFIVMLMCRGVSTTRIPAPDKLNKRRRERERPPIRDRYIVSITVPNERRLVETEDGADDITGHKRASPRMHWRRGHFRTIHRGTDREYQRPIEPVLVAANADSEIVRAASYRARPRMAG